MKPHRKKETALKPLSDSTLGALIHAEQISMLYRQLPTSITGQIVAR